MASPDAAAPAKPGNCFLGGAALAADERLARAELEQSLAWVAGILLVFVPIVVRRYRRAV